MNELNKKAFISNLKKIERDESKITNLINFLYELGFFESPASTRFHLAEKGGLLKHSLNVLYQYKIFMKMFDIEIEESSMIITCLLHDLCKAGLYIGEKKPYEYNKQIGKEGHARLSIQRIERFILLKPIEKRMIKFHMGIYYTKESNPFYGEYSIDELKTAFNDNRVFLMHCADMFSSMFLE